jgi:phosphoserine phosphatase
MQHGAMEGLSVYVGDSPSDLAPLTAADVGMVVGTNPLLRTVAAAAGLAIHPLVAGEGSCILDDGVRVQSPDQCST